ncbi:MAG: type II TA system antitoxin MqsA family protein [Clostridiaceae bacterium]
MNKCVCPNCDKEVTYHLREDVIEEYKGKKVNVNIKIAVCDECNEDIFVSNIEEENLRKLYDKYRSMADIISPTDIIAFRDRYSISQRELVSILNWGKMTINRFERGALPSKTYSDTLKLIINKEDVFIEKIEEAYRNERISIKLYNKLQKSFDNSKTNLIKQIVNNSLNHEESIYNGYRKFDLERVENLISYIADNVDSLYKTSLNKYLWYIDFQNFKENVRSITGLRYVKQQFGPVIEEKGYETIVNLLDDKFYKDEFEQGYMSTVTKIISKKNYDMSIFSKEEIKTIDGVINKFKDMTCKLISNNSHKEAGWLKNNIDDLISYDYAEDLKIEFN